MKKLLTWILKLDNLNEQNPALISKEFVIVEEKSLILYSKQEVCLYSKQEVQVCVVKNLDDLLIKCDDLLVMKDHKFEVRYFKTETGPRYYVQEEILYDVFARLAGRLILYHTVIAYKGFKRVDFKLVYSSVIYLPGTVTKLDIILRPSYALIVRPILKLTFDDVVFTEGMHVNSFVKIVQDLINTRFVLEKINLSRGFVASRNILGADYPIINEVAEQLVGLEWFKMSPMNQVKVYKGITNILMLQIFTKAIDGIEFLNTLNLKSLIVEQALLVDDLKSKLRVLKSWSYSMLDNSIKQHLMKKKVLILGDIYAGFDTEYVPYEWGTNILISAQLAISTGLKIKVPIMQEYKYEGVNTRTGETYDKTLPKYDENYDYEGRINNTIKEVKEKLYPSYRDNITKILNFLFSSNNGLSITNIVKDEKSYIFQIKRTDIKKVFILPEKEQDLKINFDTLTKIISEETNIEYDKCVIFQLLTRSLSGKDKQEYLLKEEAWDNKDIKISKELKTIILSNEENEAEKSKCSFFTDVSDLCSLKTRIYLASHYNAADLGMIADWSEVSFRNIDILKKSYTSLSAPIMSLGQEVHIRDTILLSSAAASSLDAVGKAYKINKVEIPVKYYPMMDKLLTDNRKLFESYAMQDSIITLVHTLFMNDFVLKLSDLKVPSTLGSISAKYLKKKWRSDKYRGYQADPEFNIGNTDSHTPKGLSSLGVVGDGLNQFISSFRGGRNECFRYGIDTTKRWFDYDLTSCYSTIMSMCGDPNYKEAEKVITAATLNNENLPEEQENSSGPSVPSASLVLAAEKKFSSEENISKQEYLPNLVNFAALKKKGDEDFTLESLPSLESLEKQFQNDETDETKLAALTPTLGNIIKDPDYSNAVSIIPGFWKTVLNSYDFINSYSALRVSYYFPPAVLYPPIPEQVKVNNTYQTIYSSTGKSTITGLEFLSACNIIKQYGGAIKVLSGTYIPFKKDTENTPAYAPFFAVINDLQANRAKWKKLTGKKSAMERIYKDLGNMLYGKTVSGIGRKDAYSSRLLAMKKLTPGELTNPLIGAWITGFVRALLAELLNIVSALNGEICSVTTDGFVTDIPNLEERVIEYINEKKIKNSFLLKYREARQKLSDDPTALEVKTTVRGLIQWTTRGQLSYNHTDPDLNNYNVNISALTGFQSKNIKSHDKVKDLVINALETDKSILFMQTLLTGSLENYKFGQDVSMLSSLRKYRTVFDSKRMVCLDENSLLKTIPYINTEQFIIDRTLLDTFRQSVYSASYSRLFVKNITAKNSVEDMIRFIFRLYAARYNWSIPAEIKFDIIRKVQNVLDIINIYKFKSLDLLDMINICEQVPGIIANKLPVYRNTQLFLETWFDLQYDIIDLDLRNVFSNFILPLRKIEEIIIQKEFISESLIANDILLTNFEMQIEISRIKLLDKNSKISANLSDNNSIIITINGIKYLRI